ncbi:hypothetical protein HX038_16580 [Myroides odoratimimus]|uniref:DUF6520 family protein n=1 Tax=Myroides TaxID=76831 RepID=UPI001CE07163|nr:MULTISPECIES: DUF6520 family protein [Myroides]MCA4808019.1 hypothetical protein [Myroides odoratimimus]MDM1086406.1 hypothetical protein [Myroides odoratimimus]MDM1376707.1 hypothetical protein [Myroides marinus]MDM1401731.1 hypothetical protein [Myroides odoratimimus]MDM1412343.1 hypothetical protein [Myroides odoratimimus]
MKRFLKSAGLPIGVFALAIGSAFATNAMKNTFATEPGYQKIDEDGLECFDPKVMCSTIEGPVCTWDDGTTTHTLYGEQIVPILGTVCTKPLSRITP